MVTTRYSDQQRDPTRDKILGRSNQPRTSETYRRQDDVFGHELRLLLSQVLIQAMYYREDCLMCCPSNKVTKRDTRSVLALTILCYTIGGLHEDKLCETFQGMAPTNVKMVHQTSLFYIESNLNRFGLLSSTHGQRSQHQSWQTTLQTALINQPKFLKATHHTEIRNNEIPRSMVKALSW